MSTDHYSEAQRLADQAHDYTYGDGADPVTGNALAAEAQVHATLALVDAIRALPMIADPSEECTCGHRRIDHDRMKGCCNIGGGTAEDDISCYCYGFEASR